MARILPAPRNQITQKMGIPHRVRTEGRWYHLLAERLQAQARSLIPGIAREDVEEFLIGLPPLAEQERIVAKVDELMALCDRLEAARLGREATRDRLAAASLARLNAPDPDPALFADHARFALDNLPALATRPNQIKQIRQTILNLSVRGKLVPQDERDEPTSKLLKGIREERAGLVKRGLIRREKPLDPVLLSEAPFAVPRGWKWSRIGDAVLFTQYGTSQKSEPSEKGVAVLTMGNIQDGLVIWATISGYRNRRKKFLIYISLNSIFCITVRTAPNWSEKPEFISAKMAFGLSPLRARLEYQI